MIELTRLNELTVKRKTAITLIRHYHANLFFVFFIVLHRASGRKEEEEFFFDYGLERRYSGFWEYLIETFVEFEHPCCSERLLQRL